MRDLHKPVDGLLVQAVDIGLVVEPRVLFVQLQIGRPHRFAGRGLVILTQTAIGVQLSRRVERHAVARDPPAVRGDLHVFLRREQQVPLAVLLVLRHKAARRARRVAILVVEVGQHLFLLRLVGAGAHELHELVGQVGRGHARAHVHVEAAHAHALQLLDLPQQLILVKLAVPRPEGRCAVFARRVQERDGVQLRLAVFGIKHSAFLPDSAIFRTRSTAPCSPPSGAARRRTRAGS